MRSDTSAHITPTPRLEPTIGAGAAVLAAYAAAVLGIQAASGVAYDQWFDSTAKVLTAPLPAFATGAVLLLGFWRWSRWDRVWRDRPRLTMGFWLWLPAAMTCLSVMLLLTDVPWASIPLSLVAVTAVTTILAGLCEELLFRGLLLRCLRETYGEAFAVAVLSLTFGLFHLVNLVLGATWGDTLAQVLSAFFGGISYYLLRRGTGLLVVPVAIHALFDLAVVLAPGDPGLGGVLAGMIGVPGWIAAGIGLSILFERDRTGSVRPEGPAAPTDVE